MTEKEIKAGLERLAPFHHRVDLPFGLSTHIPELSRREIEATRVESLVQHAFPALLDACGGSLEGRSVLDLACNCGGFSVAAHRRGSDRVLGVDIIDHYIEQARFIKRALGLDRVDFERKDIDDLEAAKVGEFDITFCFGILYNLENPIATMKRVAALTKRLMLVDTALTPTPDDGSERRALWRMHFPSKPDARGAGTNLWRGRAAVARMIPNRQAVVDLLNFLGFATVEQLEATEPSLTPNYFDGGRATFLALR